MMIMMMMMMMNTEKLETLEDYLRGLNQSKLKIFDSKKIAI